MVLLVPFVGLALLVSAYDILCVIERQRFEKVEKYDRRSTNSVCSRQRNVLRAKIVFPKKTDTISGASRRSATSHILKMSAKSK